MKKIISIVGIILWSVAIGYSGYMIGKHLTTKSIDNHNVSLNQIKTQLKDNQVQLQQLVKDEATKRQDLESISQELKEAKALLSHRNTLKEEVDHLEELNKKVIDAKQQLEKVQHAIILSQEKPKELAAGQYKVGKDFEAGRYKIESNVDNDSTGNLFTSISHANVILGNNSYSQKEYIANLIDGENLDVSIPFKLTKVLP